MIARVWRGSVAAERADEYRAYPEGTGLKGYRATPGNRGIHVLRRIVGDEAEFVLISRWDALAATRAFAGDDAERAVYYPQDGDHLCAFAPGVGHDEVAE